MVHPRAHQCGRTLPAAVLAALAFSASARVCCGADSIAIAKSRTAQVMDGFGASACRPTYALMHQVGRADQTAVLDFLFMPSGLGLSMVRMEIEPYLKTDPNPTLALQATIEPSPGTWDFDSDAHQKWFAQQAIQRGVSRFFALPWSPPRWMKSNGGENGGTLKPDGYAPFAVYLERYVLHYGEEGIPIQWLGLQNEPNVTNVRWACCGYAPGADYNRLVDQVSVRLSADGLPVDLVGPETGNTQASVAYMNAMDPATRSRLAIESTHNYARYQSGTFAFGKPVWMTEHCFGKKKNDSTMADGIKWADEIVQWLQAGASAYFFWYAVDAFPFPATDSSVTEQALITLTQPGPGENYAYSIPKRAYVFGQFSRFVRPGYLRVASASSSPALKPVAFVDPANGAAVIVVVNDGNTDATATVFGLSAGKARAYRTSDREAIAPLGDVGISSGSLIMLFPAGSVTTLLENLPVPPAPPAAVTTLAAANGPLGVRLSWTATGSSGRVGMAHRMELRYSTRPITTDDFASTARVKAMPAGRAAGTIESFVVSGLAGGTTYYFAVKAVADTGLTSVISNVVSLTTPPAPPR